MGLANDRSHKNNNRCGFTVSRPSVYALRSASEEYADRTPFNRLEFTAADETILGRCSQLQIRDSRYPGSPQLDLVRFLRSQLRKACRDGH